MVFLALGANLGDRMANLRAALQALPPEVQPAACSAVYETPPWGYVDQPAFLNQVIQAETTLEPQALLSFLKDVEQTLGRQPNFRNGPRLIDLDILLYDDLVLNTSHLIIPHPRLAERAFVLAPLAEIAPDLPHPLLHRSMAELLSEVDASGIHRYGQNCSEAG